MKRFVFAIMALVMAMTSVNAQRLTNVSFEAQYITDMMALELGLTKVQRNSILQLNLNYLSGIASYRDIDSRIWRQRNTSLRGLLTAAQWRLYRNANYFYRPIGWKDGYYVHNIYTKYPGNRGYHKRPKCSDGRKYGKGKKHGPKFDRPDRHGPNKHRHDRHGHDNRRERTFGSRR